MPTCPPNLDGWRALVVDDEPHLSGRLRADCGAAVTVAASGTEAISLIGRQPFDVLGSDIGRANVDGYGLIRAVRQMTENGGDPLPALAVTAFAQPAYRRRRCLVAGYDVHLAKPRGSGSVMLCLGPAPSLGMPGEGWGEGLRPSNGLAHSETLTLGTV